MTSRNDANGTPELCKTGERFREVQESVFKAANIEGAAHTHEGAPEDGYRPKPVQIRILNSGRVVTVNHDTAIQRIFAGIAELVTE